MLLFKSFLSRFKWLGYPSVAILFCWLLVPPARLAAQVTDFTKPLVNGVAVASEFGQWSMGATIKASGGGAQGTIIFNSPNIVLPDSSSISPFVAGESLQVSDPNSALNEAIILLSVSCQPSVTTICTGTANFQFAHPFPVQVRSATDGLQEAVNYQASRGGGTVLITSAWTGGTAQIMSLAGFNNVLIHDIRAGASNWYTVENGLYSLSQQLSGAGTQARVFNGVFNAANFSPGFLNNPAYAPLVRCLPAGGSVAAGAYSVEISYANFAGETLPSPASPPVICAGSASQLLIAANPADPFTGGTEGFYVYIQTNGSGPYVLAAQRFWTLTSASQIGNFIPASISAGSIALGSQTVTPMASISGVDPMSGISGPAYVIVSPGQTDEEIVQLTAYSFPLNAAGTWTAFFTKTHAAGVVLQPVGFVESVQPPTSGSGPSPANTARISSLQVAYNAMAAAGGGALNVPPGNFILPSALVMDASNTTLACSPLHQTTLTIDPPSGYTDSVILGAGYAYPGQSGLLQNDHVYGCVINGNQAALTHTPNDTYGEGINMNYFAHSSVEHNYIENVADMGAVFEGGTFQSFDDHLNHNEITNWGEYALCLCGGEMQSSANENTYWAPRGTASGIYIAGSGNSAVAGGSDDGDTANDNIGYGNRDNNDGLIAGPFSDYSTFNDNTIMDWNDGIHAVSFNPTIFNPPSHLVISGNVVYNSVTNGILFNCASAAQGDSQITGNAVYNSGSIGILDASCGYNNYSDNISYDNGGDGLQSGGMHDSFTGNKAYGNAGFGFEEIAGSEMDVKDNDLSGNTAGAVTGLDATSIAADNRTDNTADWNWSGATMSLNPANTSLFTATSMSGNGLDYNLNQSGIGTWTLGMSTPGSSTYFMRFNGSNMISFDHSGDVSLNGYLTVPVSADLQINGSQIAAANLSNGVTGSGPVALAVSPSFTTPSLGAASATSLALNGDAAFSASPRMIESSFLPGALTGSWTASSWIPDKAITITRVEAQAKTSPAGCVTNAVVQLSNGTTPVTLAIAAAANDSGAISQNYAAGATLTLSVLTPAAGCATSPADVNVEVQYRMQ